MRRDSLNRFCLAGLSIFWAWCLGTAALAAERVSIPLIQNGDMTAGAQTPPDWTFSSYKVGKVELQRDTSTFKSAPASLLVQTDGPAATMVHQAIATPLPKTPITIEGFARLEGEFKNAQIAVQVFDGKWSQIDWKPVAKVEGGGEWKPFRGVITLPPAAVYALVGLSIEGTGKAWLDDVRVTTEAEKTQTADPLPVAIAPDDPLIRYVGRFDTSDPAAPRCAWPNSSLTIRFQGTAANIEFRGGNSDRWQVIVDGQRTQVLKLSGAPTLFRLASGLPAGEHTVTLIKRTETIFGVSQILGLQLSDGGKLLPVPAARHRLEVIGDSISAGYGNEAANEKERFSCETEDASRTYGALAAAALNADYVSTAWSGKCMWPKNTIPEIYGRTLPQDPSSTWDFARWQPEAVVINLGTNDFAGGNPEEEGWVRAYKQFVAQVRKNYPQATIFCSLGPMLSDQWSPSKNALSTCRKYLNRIVDECQREGETRIFFVEFPMQTGSNGFGADWHPSLKQDQAMAEVLTKTLREKLGW